MKRFYNLYKDIKAKLQEEIGAVTLTERFRAHIGNKAFRVHECVLPADSATISAASLDLNFIEGSWVSPMKQTLSAGSVTGLVLKTGSMTDGDPPTDGITISGIAAADDKVMLFTIGH